MLVTDAIERLEEELREAEDDRRSALRAAEIHGERAEMLRTAIACLRGAKVRTAESRDPAIDVASTGTAKTNRNDTIRAELRLPGLTARKRAPVNGRKLTMREAVQAILAEQDTVCSATSAERSGHPQNSCSTTLTLMLRDGEVVRVSRGVYAAAEQVPA